MYFCYNSAKRVRLTREIARRLVAALRPEDEISVIQFNSKIELLQNWTIDKTAVLHALDTGLISLKRARFLDAVIASAGQFRDVPQANRHVVMITDGVQTAGERVDRAAAFKQLSATNAVVHVISYTRVSRQAMKAQRRPTRKRDKSLVPDEVVDSLPRTADYNAVRQAHEPG
ncbi:MAG: vWA domain-containing protein, partial [Pyrinomonadaceae bacterium]